MPRSPKPYQLSAPVIASSVGAGVMCLAAEGIGVTYRLHSARPGPETNQRVRADLPSGAAHVIAPVESASPLIRVDISGPLEQRAGYHDPCDGWSDGHDAVADRLCAAFTEGDVLLVVDSPGGAAAGLQQAVARALAAKAEHGRRVTVFADEMIGSAAMWWAAALGDEILIPPAGEVGSIGARSEHMDVSGMMAKEGLKKTYFADPPEKVALAPEFPLSAVGAMRGNRDVSLAADAFRAAICASPLGQDMGLTPEYLIELGADMLTGQAAVDAGLAHAVRSFDETVAEALATAESGPEEREMRTSTGATRAKGDRAMSLRTSGAAPGARAEAEKKEEAGRDIPTKCSACHVENEKDAKFCKGCGESMATEAVEDPDKEPESKPPPSSKDPASAKAAGAGGPPERMQAPKAMSATASLASILGASSDTPAALKTAAIGLRRIKDTMVGVVGQTDNDAIIGAALNIPSKIAAGKKAAQDLADQRAIVDEAERGDLVRRLNETAAVARTKLYADAIDDAGNRILDASGKPKVRIRTRYATMELGMLRGLVTDLEGDAPKKRKSPFEPDAEAAKAAADAMTPKRGEPTKAQVEAAKSHPTVVAAFRRSGNTLTLDKIAESHARLFSAGGTT